jgi:hypothetical protein
MRSAFGSGQTLGEFPVVCFDEWARETKLARLDLVKMDIEGGELAALLGMRETLVRLRPKLLIIEINQATLRQAGVTEEQLYAEVARSGYVATEKFPEYEGLDNVSFAPSDSRDPSG